VPEPSDEALRIEHGPGERVLFLEGELDMADTDALLTQTAALTSRPGDLTLDLGALTFIDSSGLLALLRTAQEMSDGRLILSRPTEQVRKVSDMVELAAVSPRIVIAD
jgi:anti-anti-sigma factor